MTLQRSLSIAVLFASAACVASPPLVPPTGTNAPPIVATTPEPQAADVAKTPEPPAADSPVPRARMDARSLQVRVSDLRHKQSMVEILEEIAASYAMRCNFYFDPNDRPPDKLDTARDRLATPISAADVERLARDIDAFRDEIRDDQERARFDRDVTGPFTAVKARIAASARR
jgi:hypothetical protein